MAEHPKLCMLCGMRPVETSSICDTCSEGVRREALGQQVAVKRQADKEVQRQGVHPDQPMPKP